MCEIVFWKNVLGPLVQIGSCPQQVQSSWRFYQLGMKEFSSCISTETVSTVTNKQNLRFPSQHKVSSFEIKLYSLITSEDENFSRIHRPLECPLWSTHIILGEHLALPSYCPPLLLCPGDITRNLSLLLIPCEVNGMTGGPCSTCHRSKTTEPTPVV